MDTSDHLRNLSSGKPLITKKGELGNKIETLDGASQKPGKKFEPRLLSTTDEGSVMNNYCCMCIDKNICEVHGCMHKGANRL
jgi:hypothetical protein